MIVIVFIVIKFGGIDKYELPTLFDIPINHWNLPPKEGWGCPRCFSDYLPDKVKCSDCDNVKLVDFKSTVLFLRPDPIFYDDEGVLQSKLDLIDKNPDIGTDLFLSLKIYFELLDNDKMTKEDQVKSINNIKKYQQLLLDRQEN